MGAIFSKHGKKKEADQKVSATKSTVSSTDRAVLDLKNARDRLSRYRRKLNEDEKKLLERARVLHNEDQKNMAIKLMQLRKHKLREVENVEQQLLNVLQLVETIQSTQNTQEVFKALSSGKSALEALHNEMTVDDVLTLLDEVEEQNEIENQINNILRDEAMMTSDDEAEMERELAALMASSDKEIAKDVTDNLPPVPTTELPSLSTTELPSLSMTELPPVPTTELPDLGNAPRQKEQSGNKIPVPM